MRAGFEGGQMPAYMRMGKQRGSTSKDAMPIGPFRTSVWSVNVRDLERFGAGTEITPELLKEAGLVRNLNRDVKVLGHGDLGVKLTVSAHSFSKSAVEKIEAAGGTVTWLKPPHEPKKRRHKKGPATSASEPAASEPEEAAPDVPDEASEEPSE
jgi:ribosomal protein L15